MIYRASKTVSQVKMFASEPDQDHMMERKTPTSFLLTSTNAPWHSKEQTYMHERMYLNTQNKYN